MLKHENLTKRQIQLNLLRAWLFLCFDCYANFDREYKNYETERSLKNLYFELLFDHNRCKTYREIIFYANSLEKKNSPEIIFRVEI